MRTPSLSAAPPHWGWTNPWHLRVKKNRHLHYFYTAMIHISHISHLKKNWFSQLSFGVTFSTCWTLHVPVPGLKRMMARRHPSSVLSICMSLILLTSSVKTLQTGEEICKWKSQLETERKCQIRKERKSKGKWRKKRTQESDNKRKERTERPDSIITYYCI